ncbi:MAG: hypothetical protein ACFN4Y_03360, partial [Centipeda sp. (in: firmicutes)]
MKKWKSILAAAAALVCAGALFAGCGDGSGGGVMGRKGSAEEQTTTVFNKGQIDGKPTTTLQSDFARHHVWDSATKTYTFTKDSTINTKSITGNSADVNVNAPGVTLTLNSKENLGIQSYRG